MVVSGEMKSMEMERSLVPVGTFLVTSTLTELLDPKNWMDLPNRETVRIEPLMVAWFTPIAS
jgi:hypothetical protein